jgi:hypothetical protein
MRWVIFNSHLAMVVGVLFLIANLTTSGPLWVALFKELTPVHFVCWHLPLMFVIGCET